MYFRTSRLPEAATPSGYAWLMAQYALTLPFPPRLAGISFRFHPHSTNDWQLLPPAYSPLDTLAGHLEFALRWEGVNLPVLKALFSQISPEQMAQVVRAKPTGVYTRRLWFLYEWLTRSQLGLPDAGKVRAVPAIDRTQQFALERGTLSGRHKVIDNMPGTAAFCPLVRRTPSLNLLAAAGLDVKARSFVSHVHADLLARAAAFLLLNDSKSSFQIEGERPSSQRAARWAKAIGIAGTKPLTVAELENLQRTVIGDHRFLKLGLRAEGGFVGTHDRETQEPIPEHISARAADLRTLIEGLAAYDARAGQGGMDPVAAAATIAFGFVYIHPFEDGNGRLHRWLIHHVLAAAGYNPPGIVFPVSAAILRELDAYRRVLQQYSKPLLEVIEWRPTPTGNVEVLNETADFYRYFDATAHAEFLYRCVQQTVERDLPEEVTFLIAYDRFSEGLQQIVDMPARTIDLLHRFLRQSNGRLSLRSRKAEFAAFTDEEVKQVEALYASSFDAGAPPPEALADSRVSDT